jgi:hypothetical protein
MAKFNQEWLEYVGVSKTTNTDGMNPFIQVFLPELLPNADGCLPHDVERIGGTKCPFSCTCGQYDFFTTRCVKAVFMGDNNHMVPCVHEGERVRVKCYAGTEQYYWEPMGRDPSLRRHERIRWFAMAQPVAVVSPPSYVDYKDTNSYFIEFNTNVGKKEFHIHTSKLETEKHTYDIHILPEKGMFILRDDIVNELKLWSCDHKWRWENTDGSYIELDKENINIFCKDTINVEAGKHINIKAGETYDRKAPEETVSGKNYTCTMEALHKVVSKSHTVECNSYNQKAQTASCIKTASYILNAQSATYEAQHLFKGDGFVVATASGTVPVIILLGSNTW